MLGPRGLGAGTRGCARVGPAWDRGWGVGHWACVAEWRVGRGVGRACERGQAGNGWWGPDGWQLAVGGVETGRERVRVRERFEREEKGREAGGGYGDVAWWDWVEGRGELRWRDAIGWGEVEGWVG
jgi:hypothetical protein